MIIDKLWSESVLFVVIRLFDLCAAKVQLFIEYSKFMQKTHKTPRLTKKAPSQPLAALLHFLASTPYTIHHTLNTKHPKTMSEK